MGSLMRKMSELTGESMDEPMEEVVRKLEEGMNPDELEERMGDLDVDETENSSDSEKNNDSKLKRLFRKRKCSETLNYTNFLIIFPNDAQSFTIYFVVFFFTSFFFHVVKKLMI